MAGTGAQSARGLLGGGEAGSWQHRRSPYHLACYAYHMSHKQKSCGQCQNEGKQWSKDLKDNNSDPPEDPDVIQVKKKILLLRRKSARQPRPPSEQTQSAGTTTVTTKKGPDGHGGGGPCGRV